jgi:hypothetical protein
MARTKTLAAGDHAALPAADTITRRWARAHGTYIAGRAYLDEADQTAAEMEAKWGCGRLRLLVPPELRERFDRQRYLLNQAVWHGDLEDVRTQAQRMVRAWYALDRTATEAGKAALDPLVWETPLADGSVAAIVPDAHHAHRVVAEGRRVNVYTLEEVGRLLDGYPELARVKHAFPGAKVEAVRRSIPDPLDAVHDTSAPIDQELDDELPF